MQKFRRNRNGHNCKVEKSSENQRNERKVLTVEREDPKTEIIGVLWGTESNAKIDMYVCRVKGALQGYLKFNKNRSIKRSQKWLSGKTVNWKVENYSKTLETEPQLKVAQKTN